MSATFDERLAEARGMVEEWGSTLEAPDSDWSAAAFLWDAERLVAALVLGALEKDLWPSAVRRVTERHGAAFVAVVMSTWNATGPFTPERMAAHERDGVRSDPAATEAVLVECSDGRRQETWVAAIERRPDGPPTLGPWKPLTVTSGRLAGVALGAFPPGGHA